MHIARWLTLYYSYSWHALFQFQRRLTYCMSNSLLLHSRVVTVTYAAHHQHITELISIYKSTRSRQTAANIGRRE